MRKQRIARVAVLLFGLLLTGCGKTGTATPNPPKGTAQTEFHPCGGQVIVGQYKGLKLGESNVNITEADVDAQIRELLLIRPNYVRDETKDNNAVADGDTVNIDFLGRVNGTAFEGGKAEGYDLVIGSGSFIEGFESGLIGAKVGETRTVDATFPDPYDNKPSLAGVTAQFEVKINYFCKKSDEITDEYVKKNTRTYNTVGEFRDFIRENMIANAKETVEESASLKLLNTIVESSTFEKIDDADIEYYYRQIVTPYERYAQQSGMELGTFLSLYTNYASADEMYEKSREIATESVKQFMVLQYIADTEQITVTEQEYEDYVTGVKESGEYADNKAVEDLFGREFLEYSKRMEKTLDYLVTVAVP